MERLSRVLAAGASVLVLGSVVFSAGCRSMRNEVPPSKPYSTNGGGPPPFSSDPHPNNSLGSGLYPNGMNPGSPGDVNAGSGAANSPAQLGTPAPNAGPYLGPNANPYSRGGVGGANQ